MSKCQIYNQFLVYMISLKPVGRFSLNLLEYLIGSSSNKYLHHMF